MKIATAIFLGLMILFLLPQAKHMLHNSPSAQPGDWRAFLLPSLVVAAFVVLLMWLV